MNVVVFTVFAGHADRHGNCDDHVVAANRIILYDLVDRILGKHGATVIDGRGFYRGRHEPGSSIIVISPQKDRQHVATLVYRLASDYRNEADQQEVWVTIREEKLEII